MKAVRVLIEMMLSIPAMPRMQCGMLTAFFLVMVRLLVQMAVDAGRHQGPVSKHFCAIVVGIVVSYLSQPSGRGGAIPALPLVPAGVLADVPASSGWSGWPGWSGWLGAHAGSQGPDKNDA